MKVRKSGDGIHFFDRKTGLNILLDEVSVARDQWSSAPRFVSFALTNECDLHCPFCYAPKRSASLKFDQVLSWAVELDENGCLGVGFGGGEPTLYPGFGALCRRVAAATTMAVTFTTHAHSLTPDLRDELAGAVNFVRVSVDGVGATYERFRQRPFSELVAQIRLVAGIGPFGINFVVNDNTVGELTEAAELALEFGAAELLFLPQFPTGSVAESTRRALAVWIAENPLNLRLCIAEGNGIDGIPLADPFATDNGVRAYVHVNASGRVSQTSYRQQGAVVIAEGGRLIDAVTRYAEGLQ
jgi:MoaA/NifB/PqqE/SkfB family radical SAM enzyme